MKEKVGAIVFLSFALIGCSTTISEKAHDKLCMGTRKPYQVKGCVYTPQDHYEYAEEGVASWYGPHFHGRPKSCGEIFNMHGISAAHKTLPIPSVVRVTNVRNGTSVKLLVDDRGPFVDDRIIDLSKGAATYLGICNQGVGRVRVECLPQESKAFAQFVAQYGRYGRDPNGRSWEAIFRQRFDQDSETSFSKMPKPIRVRGPQKRQGWPISAPGKKVTSSPRTRIKPAPVAQYAYKKHKRKTRQSEIDQLLDDGS